MDELDYDKLDLRLELADTTRQTPSHQVALVQYMGTEPSSPDRHCKRIEALEVSLRQVLIHLEVESPRQQGQCQRGFGICKINAYTLPCSFRESDEILLQMLRIMSKPSIWIKSSGVRSPNTLVEMNGVG